MVPPSILLSTVRLARTYQAVSDEMLVRRCAGQNPDALEELTRRYQASVYRHLLRLCGSEQDAEEMTVDVFMRVWQKAHQFRSEASVSTWLRRIAFNIAYDNYDKKRVRISPLPMESFSEGASTAIRSAEDICLQTLENSRLAEAICEALERLEKPDRDLLCHYYLDDRSYLEISADLEVSYSTLKTRLARARKRFGKQLSLCLDA
jgi:RNA polymerase sigma-70 factor (ECF subfamily)